MLTRDTTVRLNPLYRLQWEAAQEQHVLLYPEGMIQLSFSAAEILKHCQTVTTIGAIIEALEKAFPDAEGLAQDVLDFLKEAYEQHWIQ